MALIIEDGTIVAGAQTYAEIADVNAYYAARPSEGTAWLALSTDEQREEALLLTTEWIESRFDSRWKGRRVSSAQELDWPRAGAIINGFLHPSDEIPGELITAISIGVEDYLTNGDWQGASDDSSTIVKERSKLDVLEEEIEYGGGGKSTTVQRSNSKIGGVLAPLLVSGDKLVRF